MICKLSLKMYLHWEQLSEAMLTSVRVLAGEIHAQIIEQKASNE